MQTFTKDGISILAVLDKRRIYEGSLYKIRIRVIYQRKIWEYTPGGMVTDEAWKELETSSRKPKIVEIRKNLQSSFELVKKQVIELSDTGNFSFDMLNNRLRARSADTINIAFKTKIRELEKEGREGTRLYYDNVLKGIERFSGENVKIKSVNVSWLKAYENFLLSEKTGKEGHEKTKSYTTVGFHMRAIRAIIKTAIGNGILKQSEYPFSETGYKIPSSEGRHLALALNQIAQIVNYSDGKDSTVFYRDLWVFSYLCSGINFADLISLKYSDIQDGEIVFLRQKTINTQTKKKYIRASLTDEMRAIIDRWGNKPLPNNFIFPLLQGGESKAKIKSIVKNTIRHTNNRLERIGRELGLGKVTTYTARHSFATVLQRSGTSISFISESLGHSNISVTGNYLAGFEKEERIKNAAKLTKFDAKE